MRYAVLILGLSLILFSGCSSTSGAKKPDGASKPGAEASRKDKKEDEAGKWFAKGLVAMNRGNYLNAEMYFLETLKLAPKSYNAHMCLARVYEDSKQKTKAVGVYQHAIKINEKEPRGYNGLMGVYLDMGLAREAVKVGNEALRKGVPEKAVDISLGWAYYIAGDLAGAEPRLKAASDLIKNDTAPLNDLGLVYFCQGRYKEALENFIEADRLNPASIMVPYFMALTYNKLGEKDKVIGSLKEGLRRDPALASKAANYNVDFFPRNTDTGDLSESFKAIKGGK